MDNRFIRTEMLLGTDNMEKLSKSIVAVFGIGGVGSYVVEALARCGIGKFILVDNDTISVSNINRQIHATNESVGQFKTDIMKKRILSINPYAVVDVHNVFFLTENNNIINDDCNYIVDAIDTVTGKIELVMQSEKLNIPIVSSMGTGNKLNPTMLEVSDIYKTSVCPLAKVMRKELKCRGIKKLKVVYSKELPLECRLSEEDLTKRGEVTNKRNTPGSISFVPPVAGLIIASEVIKDLMEV